MVSSDAHAHISNCSTFVVIVHRQENTALDTRYAVQVSESTEDPEWDTFVAAHPGGDHAQTSLWACLKAMQGGAAMRILIREGRQVVAGAQLLLRRVSISQIGYVPKGPLFAADDPELLELMMEQLREVARRYRLQYLAVQPANSNTQLVELLTNWKYVPTPLEVASTATTRINLTADHDAILSAMNRDTRYGIRRSGRDGVTVREGTFEDLPTFYHLLMNTSDRQRFHTYELLYHEEMWRLFAPPGYLKLFIAEYEGKPTSAATMMTFGDTVVGKQRGWSGEYSNHHPNQALDWAMIQWAKAAGYCYFDMGGFNRQVAQQLLAGEPLPEEYHQSPLSYKLGYGGEIVLFPECYAYIPNPVLRAAFRLATSTLANWPLVKRTLNHLRTT